MNFDEKPIIVFYEITRACMLNCKHCRANAVTYRDPAELTLEQIDMLTKELQKFGRPYPIIIITGGDPLMRPDLFDILELFHERKFFVNVAFSGTLLATEKKIAKLADLTKGVAVSLDGATARVHDKWRGIPNTYNLSINIIKLLKQYNIKFQINTTVGNFNVKSLQNFSMLLARLEPVTWDLFFLIPTGRASTTMMITPEQAEHILTWLYQLSKMVNYKIKVTEAPFYNRIKVEHGSSVVLDLHGRSIIDGRGTVFISHTGEVNPTGFLPVNTGNVKYKSIVDIYRHSLVFKELRNPDMLKGKCGRCKFKYICGGSRARAYAVYGDYMAEDPLCNYQA